ncbi:phage virion morphogenesis protein [Jeongeupia wiesaeckerbachi]|uniref:phage virion morphogenesis protein n=1 Tax=Jeongeupia wiesaeckerbachi TaxID=3051218 RepID=UPI003D806BB7
MQHTGDLAASITADYGHDYALVGSNKVYAAMQQFGGDKADFPNLWGDVPARPFLPIDADGKLQPEAKEEVLDTVLRHLQTAARI